MTANMWATTEMQGAQVTHGKEQASLIKVVQRLGDTPEMSFSATLGSNLRQATKRLFDKEAVTPQHLIAGHV